MGKNEILEGNKLIAEFMGYEYIPRDLSDTSYQNYGWWKKGTYYNDADALNNDNFFTIQPLKYSQSWDWLIPVVEKIALSKYPVNLYFSYIQNTASIFELNTAYTIIRESEHIKSTPSIMVSFMAVVEFIKISNKSSN